jgi:hypothetical protein
MSDTTILEPELEAQILALGEGSYSHLRYTDGKVCGLARMAFTWGLMYDMGRTLWDAPCRRRYCYEDKFEALKALIFWNGQGDPPGPWIKMKGLEGEKLGPGALEGAWMPLT